MDMQTHDMLGALVIFEVLEWYFSRNCRVQCPPSGSKQDALHPELTLLQKTATHTQLQKTRSHTCILVFMCITICICILVTRCTSSSLLVHFPQKLQPTHTQVASVFQGTRSHICICIFVYWYLYLYFGNKMHVILLRHFSRNRQPTHSSWVFSQGTRSG